MNIVFSISLLILIGLPDVSAQNRPGFVHYSEDFSSGGPLSNQLPNGWHAFDASGNNNNWIWSTSAPGGQYSSSTTAINSPTASNGFLSFPSDAYNTPRPNGGFVQFNSMVVSSRINLDSTVESYELEFYQSQRFCCGYVEYRVELSSDSLNWTSFSTTNGRGNGVASPNAEKIVLDVTSVLGNKASAYIRFRKSFSSHFYWMIDDLKLVEGGYDYNILGFQAKAGSQFSMGPAYTKIPLNICPDIEFNLEVEKTGARPMRNAYLIARYYLDSLNSNSLIQIDSVLIDSVIIGQQVNQITLPSFNVVQKGSYAVEFLVMALQYNMPIQSRKVYNFTVGDTILAKDQGIFSGTIGPINTFGSTNVGDGMGTLINIDNNGGTLSSLSIYVGNQQSVIGSAIVPMVWEVDTVSNSFPVYLQGLVIDTISASEIGTWVNLPFAKSPGSAPNHILRSGRQYLIGWQQVNGLTHSAHFSAGRAMSMEAVSGSKNNYALRNGTSVVWREVNQIPGIRANFFKQTVSLDKVKVEDKLIALYPNPSSGFVQVELHKGNFDRIDVYDLKGKVVLTQTISPNRKQVSLDLSHLNKAVYLIKVSGENTQVMKKLILH